MFARVESGDSGVQERRIEDILYVRCGHDPFLLLRESFRRLSEKMGTFRVREDKVREEGGGGGRINEGG